MQLRNRDSHRLDKTESSIEEKLAKEEEVLEAEIAAATYRFEKNTQRLKAKKDGVSRDRIRYGSESEQVTYRRYVKADRRKHFGDVRFDLTGDRSAKPKRRSRGWNDYTVYRCVAKAWQQAGFQGEGVRLSQAAICRRTKLSTRTVRRAIARLTRSWLKAADRGRGNKYTLYALPFYPTKPVEWGDEAEDAA